MCISFLLLMSLKIIYFFWMLFFKSIKWLKCFLILFFQLSTVLLIFFLVSKLNEIESVYPIWSSCSFLATNFYEEVIVFLMKIMKILLLECLSLSLSAQPMFGFVFDMFGSKIWVSANIRFHWKKHPNFWFLPRLQLSLVKACL